MANSKDESLEETFPEWGEYPQDLPIIRRLGEGPLTPEAARRFLDADYPLPGTFPKPSRRRKKIPAWIEYLEKGVVYPGTKLEPKMAEERQALVDDFKSSDYSDPETARELFEFDRQTGFNPIFEFQYAVINFPKWSEVLVFELNGVIYTLHWHDQLGWAINQEFISEDPEISKDSFALFELIASSLENPDQLYPVVYIRKHLRGSPAKIFESPPGIRPGKLDEISIKRFGLRRNPDEKKLHRLRMLEEDFWEQSPSFRQKELKQINALRAELGMPQVDISLNEIIEPEILPNIPEIIQPKPKEIIDTLAGARILYQDYLAKEKMMKPHRNYCKKIINATQSVGGKTPVMPLAIMGTAGGPILCDTCHKQFPLEGGKWQGIAARTAWDNNPERSSSWVSFISGHIMFFVETNGTFRAYHGFEHTGCMQTANIKDEKARALFNAEREPIPYELRKNLDEFLLVEQGISDKNKRHNLIEAVFREMFGYDPGIGINGPN